MALTPQLPGPSLVLRDSLVLQFDSDGRFVRAIGEPGQGPGDFMSIGAVFVAADIVGAVDMGGMELEVFDYENGEPIGAIDLEPTMRITSLSAVGDSIWISGMERGSWMSVGTTSPAEIVALAQSLRSRGGLQFDRIAAPIPCRVNAYGARQCADTPIPTSGIGQPRAVLLASQLLVVDQSPGPTPENVTTVLRRYEVNSSVCEPE